MGGAIDVLAYLNGLCSSICNLFKDLKNVFTSIEFQKVMVQFRDFEDYTIGNETVFL